MTDFLRYQSARLTSPRSHLLFHDILGKFQIILHVTFLNVFHSSSLQRDNIIKQFFLVRKMTLHIHIIFKQFRKPFFTVVKKNDVKLCF